MDFLISSAYAQTAAPAAQQSPFMSLLPLLLMFAVLYFLMIRPQMKRAKEHKTMLGGLAKGDEVLTSGGLLGRVEEIGDAFLTLEIANNVRVKLQKQAITAVLPKGTLKAT